MNKTSENEITSEEAEWKEAIDKLFVELDHEYQRIRRGRDEFENSRARTRVMLDELKASRRAA